MSSVDAVIREMGAVDWRDVPTISTPEAAAWTQRLLAARDELAVDEHGQYSAKPYKREFGGHNAACEAAGLPPNGKWNKNSRRVQDAIGDVITGLDDPHDEEGGRNGA